MADEDKNEPILGELLGGEAGDAQRITDGPDDRGLQERLLDLGEAESLCAPLYRLHERRVVRDAGRMVVGFRMPTPYTLGEGMEPVGLEAPVFSSNVKKTGGAGASRLAIAVACAMAIGSTGVLTGIIGPQQPPAPSVAAAEPEQSAIMEVASTASIPDGRPVALMAVSQTPTAAQAPTVAQAPTLAQAQTVAQAPAAPKAQPAPTRVASLSPTVIQVPKKAEPAGFVRVAQKDAPTLGVSNIFGPAGQPVRLPISLNGARMEDYSFLMFRGLPTNVTLSAGFRLKESWAVSLRDLDNLMIEAPDDYQGSFNLEILLIKGRDTPAESQVISVEIVAQDIQLPPSTTAVAPVQSAPGPQVLTAAPRTIEPVERAVTAPPAVKPAPRAPALAAPAMTPAEEAMMQRAASLLQNNDVSSARLIYEHLANNGNAKAALAVGQTYDPAYLRNLDPKGLKADIGKARQWYRRAADMGDQEAPNRLSALASR